MKKTGTVIVAFLLLLSPMVLFAGCGGEEPKGADEELVNFAIESIIIPEGRDSDMVIEWMRQSTGAGDVSPDELGLLFWKYEGGTLTEITLDEYKELASKREGGDSRVWTYSQHSITVLELDADKGEAVVEIGSLYGPLAGSGIRYLLRKEDGEWKKVSEETVWVS
jgi:hypothetical protein